MPKKSSQKQEAEEMLRAQLRLIGRKAIRLLHVLDGDAPTVEEFRGRQPVGKKYRPAGKLSWDELDYLDQQDFKDLVAMAVATRVSLAEMKVLTPKRARRR